MPIASMRALRDVDAIDVPTMQYRERGCFFSATLRLRRRYGRTDCGRTPAATCRIHCVALTAQRFCADDSVKLPSAECQKGIDEEKSKNRRIGSIPRFEGRCTRCRGRGLEHRQVMMMSQTSVPPRAARRSSPSVTCEAAPISKASVSSARRTFPAGTRRARRSVVPPALSSRFDDWHRFRRRYSHRSTHRTTGNRASADHPEMFGPLR
jgi:hypothetical protein